MFFINLELRRRQIARIRVQRVEQAVKSAGSDVGQVGLGHVVVLDLLQNLSVDPHLLVGAILLAAGVDADYAELTQEEPEAKGRKDGKRDNEDQAFKELR